MDKAFTTPVIQKGEDIKIEADNFQNNELRNKSKNAFPKEFSNVGQRLRVNENDEVNQTIDGDERIAVGDSIVILDPILASRKLREELFKNPTKLQTKEEELVTPFQLKNWRPKHIFSSVKINGLFWMTKNLNTKVSDSWCYNQDSIQCVKYGRLYTWEAAKNACEAIGWRLPTDKEWRNILKSFGGADIEVNEAGKQAYSALILDGDSNLDIILGGFRYSSGLFSHLTTDGIYWTSTEQKKKDAWYYQFQSNGKKVIRDRLDKSRGFSCRCVK